MFVIRFVAGRFLWLLYIHTHTCAQKFLVNWLSFLELLKIVACAPKDYLFGMVATFLQDECDSCCLTNSVMALERNF